MIDICDCNFQPILVEIKEICIETTNDHRGMLGQVHNSGKPQCSGWLYTASAFNEKTELPLKPYKLSRRQFPVKKNFSRQIHAVLS